MDKEIEAFIAENEKKLMSDFVENFRSFMEATHKELSEISKTYDGQITNGDLAEVWKSEVFSCDTILRNFARKAMEKAVRIEEFKLIEKEEVLEVRIGEYKGYSEIIYKEDIRKKDSKEIVAWLESKNHPRHGV
ncbi:MAG TPA: hypothetical protein PL158_13305 [Bacillota bacterium]|jgi:hypothetical protein|nr:hypothetical protein [Bacillota bacterium]